MATPVERYAAAWGPKVNKGKFFVFLKGNPDALPLTPDTPEEFLALMMLSKHDVRWDDDLKLFELKARHVGT